VAGGEERVAWLIIEQASRATTSPQGPQTAAPDESESEYNPHPKPPPPSIYSQHPAQRVRRRLRRHDLVAHLRQQALARGRLAGEGVAQAAQAGAQGGLTGLRVGAGVGGGEGLSVGGLCEGCGEEHGSAVYRCCAFQRIA